MNEGASSVVERVEFCPYKGLQPYTDADRAYFFGRERDREIVISNLYASPLTVFYGASGVGKSSVLLAAVLPQLRQTPRVAVAVFRSWQDAEFETALKRTLLEAVGPGAGDRAALDLAAPLDELLLAASRAVRGPIFLILDQFEEYFLYHASNEHPESFDGVLARAVNRREVDAHFLLSMREDGLSKLDRFQGRIPNLMSNLLRLEHLDRESARSAICKPLEVFNAALPPGRPPVAIEPQLVEALLDEARPGTLFKVSLQQPTGGTVESPQAEERIETPLLQMVLTRLWEEERAGGSSALRYATFDRLGRAQGIAGSHLDKVMSRLGEAETEAAARMLRFLVTPSGSKIAHDAISLAAWAELPLAEVEPVLTRLASSDVRILRPVEVPRQALRYEIFHDVLAPAVLDWRRRYELAKQTKAREAAQRRVLAWTLALVVVLVATLIGIFWKGQQEKTSAILSADTLRSDLSTEKVRSDSLLHALRLRDSSNTLVAQGAYLAGQGKIRDALAKYGEAMAVDPGNAAALEYEGTLFRHTNPERAVATLRRSIALDPTNAWTYYNLSIALSVGGNPDAALDTLEALVRMSPSFKATIRTDTQFRALRSLPRFRAIVSP